MKLFTRFILPVFFLFFIASCSNNTPKAVAEKFLLSVAHADLDEARKYCDSNTQELLAQADYLAMVPDSVKEAGQKLKVNIVNVKENGDKAVVTYTTSKLPENQLISLIKVNDKWLVQLDKMQDQEEEMLMPENADVSTQDSSQKAPIDTAQ